MFTSAGVLREWKSCSFPVHCGGYTYAKQRTILQRWALASSLGPSCSQKLVVVTDSAKLSECHSLKNAAARICSINAAARSWANFRQRSQSSNSKYYRQYGSPKAQWTIYWTQVTQQAQPAQPAQLVQLTQQAQPAQPAQLVQLRAANAASASRAPIRSTIGSMGPQKPNEQYIERRWRSRRSQRSQRSWCSCAQPTQPVHPELQFEVL